MAVRGRRDGHSNPNYRYHLTAALLGAPSSWSAVTSLKGRRCIQMALWRQFFRGSLLEDSGMGNCLPIKEAIMISLLRRNRNGQQRLSRFRPGLEALEDRCTPSQFITFPLPSPSSAPSGIVDGPDGNLWFTEANADKIGRITPSGAITEISI